MSTWGIVAGATALAVSLLPVLGPTAPATSSPVTTVMLVGDSVTQGSSGDWTWRYRLWQHLASTGTPVDLVGPRNDLFDNIALRHGSLDYADPAFDTDHAACWGSSFSIPRFLVEDMVANYHPDVIVEMLGVNDLIWFNVLPGGVAAKAADFVEAARSVDPGVDVVLTRLPQTWLPGVAAYNEELIDVQQTTTTQNSRVAIAEEPVPLVESVDTWDAAHLSATGEVKVAAGVADALAGLGVGTVYPRPLPVVPNGLRVPAALTVTADGTVADLRWSSPPGATGEYVWMHDVSTVEPWKRLEGPTVVEHQQVRELLQGHDYAFRLQAVKGNATSEEVFSNTATVTRPPPGIAAVVVTSRRHGLIVTWWPTWEVASDVVYVARWWPKGHAHRVLSRTTGHTTLRIRGLRTAQVYVLTVRAWKSGVGGTRMKALGVPVPRA
ncbi:MAG: hypothetical protein MUE31_01285 [Candidatus Nanopelagicales bacterium]|nr:hypothetical protein [Candidatus Nanopelagicales bacterium]